MRLRTFVKVVIGFAIVVPVILIVMLIVFRDDLALVWRDNSFLYRLAQVQAEDTGAQPEAAGPLTAQMTQEKAADLTVTQRYVLIGDSRTRGMNTATQLSQSEYFEVIAESNMGYSWLVGTALSEASRAACTNYVMLLGVNDPSNINNYLAAYDNLIGQGKNLFLVTVGPVEEGRGGYSITNNTIRDFNERLYEVEGATVLDLYTYFIQEGFSTLDGVHYDDATYARMRDFLLTQLE